MPKFLKQFFFATSALLLLVVCKHQALSLPTRTLGLYTLLADDSHSNFTSNTTWQPRLYPYQVEGFNVFWFTFINPQDMMVPYSFRNLAQCRGSPGCPRQDQLIIFSIGGQLYSETTWPWLETPNEAQAMAARVAQWFVDYSIDGIDIDIEGTAGSSNTAGSNAIIFIHSLRDELDAMGFSNENAVISVPVYGYPQITAEIEVVNAAWTDGGACEDDVDSIGIMVYQDSDSLQWVPDYANATQQWQGFPITTNVPQGDIIVGLQGTATCDAIQQLVDSVVEQRLGGIMTWYGSVWDLTRSRPGLKYSNDDSDATSTAESTGHCWKQALETINEAGMGNDTQQQEVRLPADRVERI